jgi:hypothetical protein
MQKRSDHADAAHDENDYSQDPHERDSAVLQIQEREQGEPDDEQDRGSEDERAHEL